VPRKRYVVTAAAAAVALALVAAGSTAAFAVLTMLTMAAGFALWSWAATRDARTGQRATRSGPPVRQPA